MKNYVSNKSKDFTIKTRKIDTLFFDHFAQAAKYFFEIFENCAWKFDGVSFFWRQLWFFSNDFILRMFSEKITNLVIQTDFTENLRRAYFFVKISRFHRKYAQPIMNINNLWQNFTSILLFLIHQKIKFLEIFVFILAFYRVFFEYFFRQMYSIKYNIEPKCSHKNLKKNELLAENGKK